MSVSVPEGNIVSFLLLSADVIFLLTQSLCFSLTLLMFIVVLFQALTLSETSAPGPITVCISELIFFFF